MRRNISTPTFNKYYKHQIGDNMQHKNLITAFTFLFVIGSTSFVIGEETLKIYQFQQERDINIKTINTELKPDAKLKNQFKKLDINGDGALSLDELFSTRSSKRHHQIKKLFNIADTNSNGFLDLTEFRVLREKVIAKIRKRFGSNI